MVKLVEFCVIKLTSECAPLMIYNNCVSKKASKLQGVGAMDYIVGDSHGQDPKDLN